MSNAKREYSPKEVLILDAAAALLAENAASVGSLKVADIAARAGIGKGTVYEYFPSKEEILRESIIRFVTLRFEEEWARAYEKPTFKECIYCAMEELFFSDDGFCVWDLQLLSALDQSTAESVFLSIKSFCQQRVSEMCLLVTERGAKEGLFPQPDLEKSGQAFVHLFCGLGMMMRVGEKEQYKEYMDRGYEMLIRALQ